MEFNISSTDFADLCIKLRFYLSLILVGGFKILLKRCIDSLYMTSGRKAIQTSIAHTRPIYNITTALINLISIK